MHAKYEVSISYGSKVIMKVKVDNRQTDRQDKNNVPPIIRLWCIKMSSVFEGKHKQLSLVSKHDHCQNLFTMIFQLQVKFTQSVLLSKNMPLKWPWQLSIVSDSNCIIHEAQYAWKAWCWLGGGGLIARGTFVLYLSDINLLRLMDASNVFNLEWLRARRKGERRRGYNYVSLYDLLWWLADTNVRGFSTDPGVMGDGGGAGL